MKDIINIPNRICLWTRSYWTGKWGYYKFEKLTGKKVLKIQGRTEILPCISESCKFEDVKLKQHLMSKSHIFSKTHAELAESFENKKINIYFY